AALELLPSSGRLLPGPQPHVDAASLAPVRAAFAHARHLLRRPDSLAEQEADGELGVLPRHRGAHRDRDRLALQPDLEWLLAREQVGAAAGAPVAPSPGRQHAPGTA